MPRQQNRSTPLWQRTAYMVYLRVSILLACSLALIAAAIVLNTALRNKDEAPETAPAGTEVDRDDPAERRRNSDDDETFAVTGSLIAVSAVTILTQATLVLVTKCGPYIYEPAQAANLCVQLADFIFGCLLLAGCTASTLASGAVAHRLAYAEDREQENEDLFRAVAGSTAFGILSVVLLVVLCIWNSCILYSLKKEYNTISRRHKITNSNITSV